MTTTTPSLNVMTMSNEHLLDTISQLAAELSTNAERYKKIGDDCNAIADFHETLSQSAALAAQCWRELGRRKSARQN